MFNPLEFGIKTDYLYEILATTISIDPDTDRILPNTSCMGVRFEHQDNFTITPYPDTKTYKNLRKSNTVILNFVDNIYLYAVAALKGAELGGELTKFPTKNYKNINLKNKNKSLNLKNFPYVKQSWAIVLGKTIGEEERLKKNSLGELRLTEFKLKSLYFKKLKESYKLFNRAENLALESIILATRLKLLYIYREEELKEKVYDEISENIKYIRSFSRNNEVEKALMLIEKYISNFI